MSESSSVLPFEVVDSKSGTDKSSKKRLTVLVRPEKVDGIIASLSALHLDAVIYDVKSASKERERVATGRGSGTMESAYTSRKIIATIVDAGRVDDVAAAIKKELGGQTKAVVTVAPVDGFVQL
jgi:nitrogen regulatory protein PII